MPGATPLSSGTAADDVGQGRRGSGGRGPRAGHIEVLEVMSDLLSGVGEGSPPDAFFSSLCEAICRLASMKRAVLVRYDSARRRVRAVGAHGIELEFFADLFVTIDSVPVARRALVEDRVLEVVGAEDFKVPSEVRELLEGVRIVCTPMAAAGRYVGVVLSEREPGVPDMDDDERHLLWTLGKAIAMASVAREVTASDEQRRQLQQRIDLAREIHEGVVQRLFGISLALSREELLDADSQRRCAAEVQTALADLRTALTRPLGHASRPTAVTFTEELERVRALYPALEITLDGEAGDVPASLEALAQSVLVEAVRNAHKHAQASGVRVTLRQDGGTLVLEVRNDGVTAADDEDEIADGVGGAPAPADRPGGARAGKGGAPVGRQGGMGLRLATLEALQHDGVLEYGESEPGFWQVRLVVPTGQ
ncbi:MAG: putative signal transduction histidine kinase [Solirubrobacterales bacterium]|nr:putative signal transduction histidine kinase [Solirubrobacterales bacterium]